MRRSRGNLSSIHSSAQREKERSFPVDEDDQVTSNSTENQFGFRCLNRVFLRSMREDQGFHWGECWVVFVLQPKGELLLNDGGEQQGGKGERIKVHKDVPIACHEWGMSHKARQRTNTTGDEKSLVRDVRRSSSTTEESLRSARTDSIDAPCSTRTFPRSSSSSITRGKSLELHSSTPNVSRLVCFQAQLILSSKHHQAPCIHFLHPLIGVDATFDSYSSRSSRRLFEVDLFVFLSKGRFTDGLREHNEKLNCSLSKELRRLVPWKCLERMTLIVASNDVLLSNIRVDRSLFSSSTLPSNAENRLGASRMWGRTPRAKNCVLALLVGYFFFYCSQTSALFTRSVSTNRDFPSWSLRLQL